VESTNSAAEASVNWSEVWGAGQQRFEADRVGQPAVGWALMVSPVRPRRQLAGEVTRIFGTSALDLQGRVREPQVSLHAMCTAVLTPRDKQ
jgi:hypothetical protein